jgi:hypothetical protein
MTHTYDHCHAHASIRPAKAVELHSRRSIVVALASTAAAASGPVLAQSEVSPADERFMRMALDEAREGDYAFGCVITRGDEVIAHGHNLSKTNDDPTAHGEMVAIRRCLADHGSAALHGATLYTFRRTVRDVHGRDHLLRRRPVGLCRLGAADRQLDESNHDHQRRGGGAGTMGSDQDHRRRLCRRGDAAVAEVRFQKKHDF